MSEYYKETLRRIRDCALSRFMGAQATLDYCRKLAADALGGWGRPETAGCAWHDGDCRVPMVYVQADELERLRLAAIANAVLLNAAQAGLKIAYDSGLDDSDEIVLEIRAAIKRAGVEP